MTVTLIGTRPIDTGTYLLRAVCLIRVRITDTVFAYRFVSISCRRKPLKRDGSRSCPWTVLHETDRVRDRWIIGEWGQCEWQVHDGVWSPRSWNDMPSEQKIRIYSFRSSLNLSKNHSFRRVNGISQFRQKLRPLRIGLYAGTIEQVIDGMKVILTSRYKKTIQ